MKRAHVVLVVTGLLGCTPGLADPERFAQEEARCAVDVQADILVPRCASGGCHSAPDPAAGLDFTAPDLAARLRTGLSSSCEGTPLLDPANPEASYLLSRVHGDTACGDTVLPAMPPVGVALDSESLDCLSEWVRGLAMAPTEDAGMPMERDAGRPDAGGPGPDAGVMVPPAPVTIEAEAMTLEGYVVDASRPEVIRLPDDVVTGRARAVFEGTSGRYRLTLHALAENDGDCDLTVFVDDEAVFSATVPRGVESFSAHTASTELVLRAGAAIEVRAAQREGSRARLDRLELIP